jgi:SAM-dependent MidA family methyltransferase
VRALGVVADGAGFAWADRPAPESLCERVAAIEASIGAPLPVSCESEVSLKLPPFVGGLGDVLRDGVCLVIDYGLPRRELYARDRSAGTLTCHYRHRAHADPFRYPGLQDITAWVDFTALAESAAAASLRVDGFTTQAQFLISAGIEREFLAAGSAASTQQARLTLSREMQTLLMPGQMGEKFKVMRLGKGTAALAPQFDLHDQRHRL